MADLLVAPHRVGLQVAVLVAGLVAVNAVTWQLGRRTIPRALVRAGLEHGPVTDLFLGNSLVAAGLDVRAFEHGLPGRTAFNGGMGSSYPLEHLLLAEAWPHLPTRAIHYGFLDTQLTAPDEGSFATLKGNRTLAFDFPERALSVLELPSHEAVGLRVAGLFPLVVDRLAVWARVEKLRRGLGAVGLPPATEVRFGRARDFESFDLQSPAESAAEMDRARGLGRAVSELLAGAGRRSLHAYVIQMPQPLRRRERLHAVPGAAGYLERIQQWTVAGGATWVPALDWVSDEDFEDGLHLSARGAERFSTRYAEWLAREAAAGKRGVAGQD